jgi:hypothetical protein
LLPAANRLLWHSSHALHLRSSVPRLTSIGSCAESKFCSVGNYQYLILVQRWVAYFSIRCCTSFASRIPTIDPL